MYMYNVMYVYIHVRLYVYIVHNCKEQGKVIQALAHAPQNISNTRDTFKDNYTHAHTVETLFRPLECAWVRG